MNKISPIYTITTIEKLKPDDRYYCQQGDTRCVGFYYDMESAEEAVIENRCDIFECLYDYAVIEQTPQGVYGTSSSEYKRWFYKYDHDNNKYVPIEEPECVKHIYGFGIG